MNVSRNSISVALFNLLNAIVPPGFTQWACAERTLRIWSNVSPAEQPYLGITCPNNQANQTQAEGLTVWELDYVVAIYLRRDGVALPAGQYFGDVLDGLLDAIDAALAVPPALSPQTLGGLVNNCCIDGKIEIDAGLIDEQAVIIIPVKVITGS